MTAFAFILGVVPLMFATGAGAASRQSIGTTVVGRHVRRDHPVAGLRAGLLCGYRTAARRRNCEARPSAGQRRLEGAIGD